MRDEWNLVLNGQQRTAERQEQQRELPSTRIHTTHTQGLTRAGRQIESSGGDRIAGLTMASRAMRLKGISGGGSGSSGMGDLRNREVSPRRQVGDAADQINPPPASTGDGETPWWKKVGMEEGM